jgi:hypothetical protein
MNKKSGKTKMRKRRCAATVAGALAGEFCRRTRRDLRAKRKAEFTKAD